MKCGECTFCKYDSAIKEYVCSIDLDLPVVFKNAETSCAKFVADVVKRLTQEDGKG